MMTLSARHPLRGVRPALLLCLLGALFLLLPACGGTQRVEEEEDDFEAIEDIPGVDAQALSAFNDGIRALLRTPVNYDTALSSFERAVQIDPDFWEAYENIGLIQMTLERYDEAVRAFERELEVISDLRSRDWPVEARPEVYLSLGSAHALAGRSAQAIRAFERLIELEPENAEALANLAATYAASGDFEQAGVYARLLLERSQNDVGALNVLASVAKEQGDMQLAVYLWEKALDEIGATAARISDEEQYEEMSDEVAARVRVRNAQRLERLDMLHSDILNELGLQAWNAGRQARAESFFRRAVDLYPRNTAARVNLATVYLDFANFDRACEQFAETLAVRPRDLAGLIGNAACIYGQGEMEEAYDRYELVMSNYPNNAHAARRLGDIAFQARNDLEDALRWYSRNLEIRGTSVDGCNRSDEVCALAQSLRDMIERGTLGIPDQDS